MPITDLKDIESLKEVYQSTYVKTYTAILYLFECACNKSIFCVLRIF